MQSISKKLSIVASAVALTLAFIAPAQTARAQDQRQDQDQFQDEDAQDLASEPNTAGPPAVTAGCWQGEVFNDAQGDGVITFFFKIKHGKILKSGSTYDIEYTSEGLSESGPIAGKVNSKRFKWRGPAVGNQNSQCSVSGIGSPVASTNFLDGNYTYKGKCTEVSGPHNPFTGGSMGKLVFVGPSC